MLIIPAIDLKDGCVVRYVQGRTDKKIYSRDPLKTARHWVKQGAAMIHLVDLDGAMSGKPKNFAIVREIAKGAGVPVEIGGGIRSMAGIKTFLDMGVERVVLGTRAFQDPVFLRAAWKKFNQRVIVSIDACQGKLMARGWKESLKKSSSLTFGRELKAIGFQEVIYTDTSKDGTLKGPNIQDTKKLIKETGLRVIASGGVSSLDDVYKLKKLENSGLTGVIVGKALYEGRFTLAQALKLA